MAAKGTAQRIVRVLECYRLPVARPDGASVDELIEALRGEKVRVGEIRFALPQRIGVMHEDRKGGWTVGVREGRLRGLLIWGDR